MGTIADKLSLLLSTKSAIRAAIAAKGQAVADTEPFSGYPAKIAAIETGTVLPALTSPGAAGDLLGGKQLIDQEGNVVEGEIVSRTASDLTAAAATVTVPAGHYATQAAKSVATATQATPSISVDSSGLITASATQSAGYVAAGTRSATQQLTVQAAKSVTPDTYARLAVDAGRYTTGMVMVEGDENLRAENIKSGVSIFGVAGTAAVVTEKTVTVKNTGVNSGTVWVPGETDIEALTVAASGSVTFTLKYSSAFVCVWGASPGSGASGIQTFLAGMATKSKTSADGGTRIFCIGLGGVTSTNNVTISIA